MTDIKRTIDHPHSSRRWAEILPTGDRERVYCYRYATLVYVQRCMDYAQARGVADRWVSPRKGKLELRRSAA